MFNNQFQFSINPISISNQDACNVVWRFKGANPFYHYPAGVGELFLYMVYIVLIHTCTCIIIAESKLCLGCHVDKFFVTNSYFAGCACVARMWAAAVRVLGECGFEPVTLGYSLLLGRRTSRDVRRVGNKLINMPVFLLCSSKRE